MTMINEPMAVEALRIRLRALGDPLAVELERMLDAVVALCLPARKVRVKKAI